MFPVFLSRLCHSPTQPKEGSTEIADKLAFAPEVDHI